MPIFPERLSDTEGQRDKGFLFLLGTHLAQGTAEDKKMTLDGLCEHESDRHISCGDIRDILERVTIPVLFKNHVGTGDQGPYEVLTGSEGWNAGAS